MPGSHSPEVQANVKLKSLLKSTTRWPHSTDHVVGSLEYYSSHSIHEGLWVWALPPSEFLVCSICPMQQGAASLKADGLPRPGLAEFMSWWWLIYKFILDFISCLSKFGLGFTRRRITVNEIYWNWIFIENLNFIENWILKKLSK